MFNSFGDPIKKRPGFMPLLPFAGSGHVSSMTHQSVAARLRADNQCDLSSQIVNGKRRVAREFLRCVESFIGKSFKATIMQSQPVI